MRVEILNIDASSEQKPRVYFSSEFGQAWANWLENLPDPKQTYHVELSVGDTLTWGLDIAPAPGASHKLEPDGNGVAIYATLEGCEEDGFTVLRLGNSIVMVEAFGEAPPIGTIVRAHIQALTLSDTGI